MAGLCYQDLVRCMTNPLCIRYEAVVQAGFVLHDPNLGIRPPIYQSTKVLKGHTTMASPQRE